MKPLPGVRCTAEISPCGKYRYRLTREWAKNPRWVTFVMLNPSTADASQDDPTIRKIMNYAKMWNFTALEVLNLFAFRSSSPDILKRVEDPVGYYNQRKLLEACGEIIICAWGQSSIARKRPVFFREELFRKLRCLKLNDDGSPAHPLYLPMNVYPQPYMQE